MAIYAGLSHSSSKIINLDNQEDLWLLLQDGGKENYVCNPSNSLGFLLDLLDPPLSNKK